MPQLFLLLLAILDILPGHNVSQGTAGYYDEDSYHAHQPSISPEKQDVDAHQGHDRPDGNHNQVKNFLLPDIAKALVHLVYEETR